MIFGGHFENMQIMPLRHHFSACQHWFSDSAYQITTNQGVKPTKCLYLLTYLIFFLTINKLKSKWAPILEKGLSGILAVFV